MIHFQHIELLWLLLLLPLLAALWLLMRHLNSKRMERFADAAMFHRLIPDATRWRPVVKISLLLLGYAFLIITLANPQVGTKMVKGEHRGSDVAICLDVSNSMMAEDLQPNRLERSKRIITTLMSKMAGERVSLIVFAGESFTQMPLTSDYGAARLFLDQIDCSLIEAQGTDIADAIDRAMHSLGYGDSDQEWQRNNRRTIVIISDGENFEGNALQAAEKAIAEGVSISTIGIGTTTGAPIPIYNNSRQRTGYKTDASGNIVMTHLDENTLSNIAQTSKGQYVHAGSINTSLDPIINHINNLDKESYDEAIFTEYESRYRYPLVAALLCLLSEVLIFERRNRRIDWQRLIARR